MPHDDREAIKRLCAGIDRAAEGKRGVSVALTSLVAMVQLLQREAAALASRDRHR